ncbi:hypothetical protein OPV22_033355 [Ensete ventricosum]|uniref:Uncharacterized protein n=1 Tax=Ensete ventricosum TaxID=4639 RepID=A0AAV8PU39_ENSVE|nr:hypothetical protein OPV22_033355 [Ensete ventricosum]
MVSGRQQAGLRRMLLIMDELLFYLDNKISEMKMMISVCNRSMFSGQVHCNKFPESTNKNKALFPAFGESSHQFPLFT